MRGIEEMRKRRMIENREADERSGGRKQRKACPVWLGEDVLTEILVQMPVRCLARFQLVCKSWRSFISTDLFRRLHTLRRYKPPSSLILSATSSLKTQFFYSNPLTCRIRPFCIDFIDNFEILSCSNGLMLLQCKHDVYYVYNPLTKQSKKLSLAYKGSDVSLHLVYDPSESPHYKVVCIWDDSTRCHIKVLDSESGMWRACVKPFPERMDLPVDCVHSKNLIYLMPTRSRSRRTWIGDHIYCFDIDKKLSQIMYCPIPRRAEAETAYSHTLQESNGCVYYCALFLDAYETSAALWELDDDPCQFEWLLKYDQRVPCLPRMGVTRLLRFVAETSTVLISIPGNIVAYSFFDKTYKELLHLDPHVSCVDVHQFGETLALF